MKNERYNFSQIGHALLLLIGDDGCGKTSLIYRMVNGTFPTGNIPKLFGSYCANVQFGSSLINMEIWDSCNTQHNNSLCNPQTSCIILCFSISNRDSFNRCLVNYQAEIQLNLPNTPVILVGTKADLYEDPIYIKDNLITNSEGVEMASKINAVQYIETSALSDINVMRVFEVASTVSINRKNNKQHDNTNGNKNKCIIN
ncbi:hypothetical protein DICPUDRAFT_81474 [Dictyostelium purpureum]|uniref:Rho GTPase n=1 Tax=Dictyostelium purpureum TaxID=5786 RepID=F0ZTL3_DICPU|nr:uncharacterized protein DICPUDRAFT_81474 [Dictyostelium purpureum]EGC32717.1 hypothetical protein DICPUDRAFT_81474 [Dictyostelium purpureum]|eukprot:XP_003290750.1 hypothetical protein DICPUDRAFT_81474 [Dictyostelium purpureum]